MSMNSTSKSGLRCLCHRKSLVFVSLLFIIVLFFSCFVSGFNSVFHFASGVPDKVVVSTEVELRDTINNAIESTVIALDNDITLTKTIVIPANKDITIASNTPSSFRRLFGASALYYSPDGSGTLTVADGGMLRLDGIIVTHVKSFGTGVIVNSGGTLSMSGGKISGNTASNSGGGIWVNVKNLDKLFVSDGVVFSHNSASEAVPNRSSEHDDIYAKQIGSNIVWTTPFTQGYNNYDISYTNDMPISPEPSVSPSDPESNGDGGSMWTGYLVVLTIIAVIVGIVGTGLFFYFKKNSKMVMEGKYE